MYKLLHSDLNIWIFFIYRVCEFEKHTQKKTKSFIIMYFFKRGRKKFKHKKKT